MAYEHRIYIIHRTELYPRKEGAEHYIFGNVIAEYNCSRMPGSFYDLFHAAGEIDFDLYVDGDVNNTLDHYGERCKMLKPAVVIDYLENLMADETNEWHDYRRLAPLLGLLKGFNMDQWEESNEYDNDTIWVVHYGY